jgi:polysaccharide biosynthesis/export protein
MAAKTAYFSLIMGATLLSGCATMPRPANPPLVEYQREQHLARAAGQTCATPAVPAIVAGRTRVEADVLAAMPDLIGPGDRLKLMISGDADVISGSYVVAANGQLVLQGIAAIDAAGRSLAAVERAVRQALLAGGFIRDIAGNVKLTQAEAAGVRVSVEGAVFEPGLVRAGERSGEVRAATIGQAASGDFNTGRSLTTALRAAGGIRPDAAARQIYLVRSASYAVVDVTPAFTGGVPADPQLAAGDRIIVPSTSCFNADYVRPSSVTAPGIRVYLSNLARPASPGTSDAGVP